MLRLCLPNPLPTLVEELDVTNTSKLYGRGSTRRAVRRRLCRGGAPCSAWLEGRAAGIEAEVLIKHSLWMISRASLYFIAGRCCRCAGVSRTPGYILCRWLTISSYYTVQPWIVQVVLAASTKGKRDGDLLFNYASLILLHLIVSSRTSHTFLRILDDAASPVDVPWQRIAARLQVVMG